jgi:hypothetical protein
MVDPALLGANPWNTNIMTPENEAKLEASMRRHGFFRPAIVREFVKSSFLYQILGGAHRVEIAKKLGLTEIPVVNLGVIDDLQAKEIGIADNARYGVDDTIAFAELIKGMGNADELKDFLPYTEGDFDDLFASSSIDLDALDLEDGFDTEPEGEDEPEPLPKPVKTHAKMSFKVTLRDSESLTALIEKTKIVHGFTGEDDLTNAGDALVHLLLGSKAPLPGITDPVLDDVDDLYGVSE